MGLNADASSAAATCSLKKEQALPLSAARAMGLDVAAKMLGGNRLLGKALDITARAVAHKAAGARGIADDELVTTAEALEALAARITGHAAKLRGLIAP
jgi:hypothetical protein